MTAAQRTQHAYDKYESFVDHWRLAKISRQHIKRERWMLGACLAYYCHDVSRTVDVLLDITAECLVLVAASTVADTLATVGAATDVPTVDALMQSQLTNDLPLLVVTGVVAAAKGRSQEPLDVAVVAPPLPLEALYNPDSVIHDWHDCASKAVMKKKAVPTASVETNVTVDSREVKTSPRVVLTSSLTDERLQAALLQRGVTAQVVTPSIMVYVLTSADHSPMLNANTEKELEAIAKTGMLSTGPDATSANCTAWMHGQKVIGSKNFNSLDNYDGDQFHDEDERRVPTMSRPLELVPGRVPPGAVHHYKRHDGANTYTGNAARFANAQVPEDDTKVKDARNCPSHGTGDVDSQGQWVEKYATRRNLSPKPLLSGVYHVAQEFALEHQEPKYDLANPSKNGNGPLPPNTVCSVLVMFFSAQGMDESFTNTTTKWNGISSFYGFTKARPPEHSLSLGKVVPLLATQDGCTCDRCMAMTPERCLQPDNPFTVVKHFPASGVAAQRGSTRQSGPGVAFEVWAETLEEGTICAAVVDTTAKNNPEEEFFVCKLRCKPWVNPETQYYGENELEKGWWIVEMDWYEHVKTLGNGSSKYYFDPQLEPVVYNLNALIKGSNTYLNDNKGFVQDAAKGVRRARPNAYTLTHTAHAKITKYCSLD